MKVRTVLGDVAPRSLGIAYLHEHLIIDSPVVEDRFPHIFLPSVDEAVGEVGRCVAVGVGTMVDAMPCAAGRDVVKLAAIARRTGCHLVAATGLHTAKYYPNMRWTQDMTASDLADRFVADIEVGIDRFDYTAAEVERTTHRAGVIKVASLSSRLSAGEGRLFEAAGEAHARTGAPILTHCEDGLGGVQQIETLASHDVSAERIVLSHTDKVGDRGYHRDLLSRGVNLEYDQWLRQPVDQPDGTRALIQEMIGEGFVDQLMVGTDGARRSLWTELGGTPGLASLVEAVTTATGDEAPQVLVANPARVLAF